MHMYGIFFFRYVVCLTRKYEYERLLKESRGS